MRAFGKSDPGCVRKNNEDRIFIDESIGLFVVCDGMGGHSRGELAAQLAVDAVKYFITNSQDRHDVSWPFGYLLEFSVDANRLVTSVRLANRQVWRKAEEVLENTGMGTTVAVLLICDSQAVVANVGDTRVYLVRGGQFQQVSTDDTMIASLLKQGTLSAAEAAAHPMRNVLTQAAGSQETVNVHIWENALLPGDRLLLCSDGLYGAINENAIASILSASSDTEQAVNHLIASAREQGAADNVSAVLIDL